MTTSTKATSAGRARLEARIDSDLDDLIGQAASRLHMTKTAFVSEAVRDAALKVLARADVTLMDPELFDAMIASIDTPDESPELDSLAGLPRRIDA